MLKDLHKEDIKASIRKQFRTIRAFEERNGLPRGSVHEVLRGRRWKRVEVAVEAALTGGTA